MSTLYGRGGGARHSPGAAGWQDLQASLERVVAVSRNPAPLVLGAGGNWGIPGSSIADRSLETPGRSAKRVKRRSVVAPADPRVGAKVKLDADLRFSAGKHAPPPLPPVQSGHVSSIPPY